MQTVLRHVSRQKLPQGLATSCQRHLSTTWHMPLQSVTNGLYNSGLQKRSKSQCLETFTTVSRRNLATTSNLGPAPRYSKTAVPIDGEMVDMSAILLRDACACPSCVHPSTNQRLFSAADVPDNLSVKAIETDQASDNVKITWNNDVPGFPEDHETKLDMAYLRSIKESGAPPGFHKPPLPQALWTLEPLNLTDYDYNTYMTDDASLYDLIKQLRVHGLAFVTNISKSEESLAKIATRIGPIKDTFYGNTWDVRTVPQAINAAYTSSDLGFHTDLLYFNSPPHVQLLHCMQSASTGGASVFADAYRAAVDLFESDPDAFDTLATVPVNYHYNHPNDNVYRTTKPVIDLRPLRIGYKHYTDIRKYLRDKRALNIQTGKLATEQATLVDVIDKINWGPPFLAPFSSHQESQGLPHLAVSELNDKVHKWHESASKFNALLQRSEYLYERKMGPGDCVLFDNTRTLHSRRAFDAADAGKPRWLRGTYVDKDPYYSKYRVLQNRFD